MSELIRQADVLRGKYRFEIDKPLNANAFFKAKFKNDQALIKQISRLLYKKDK